jgi:hypothetical protein
MQYLNTFVFKSVSDTIPFDLSLVPFKGPKKSLAPQKVKILCRDHLETLNWPHLVKLSVYLTNRTSTQKTQIPLILIFFKVWWFVYHRERI